MRGAVSRRHCCERYTTPTSLTLGGSPPTVPPVSTHPKTRWFVGMPASAGPGSGTERHGGRCSLHGAVTGSRTPTVRLERVVVEGGRVTLGGSWVRRGCALTQLAVTPLAGLLCADRFRLFLIWSLHRSRQSHLQPPDALQSCASASAPACGTVSVLQHRRSSARRVAAAGVWRCRRLAEHAHD